MLTMNPDDILYSVPTLCDAIPGVVGTSPPGNARRVTEDDWRQVEFVGHSNSSYIQEQLVNLAAFKQEHRRGPGWTKIFIRGEHPWPLETIRIQWADLPKLPNAALVVGGGPPWGERFKVDLRSPTNPNGSSMDSEAKKIGLPRWLFRPVGQGHPNSLWLR